MTANAQAVVRRYLDALIRGNEPAAYAALGGSAGDAGLTLSEEAFLDASSRVLSMRATKIDDTNATVETEIASSKGTYYATYRVTFAARGAYISSHDYIKV